MNRSEQNSAFQIKLGKERKRLYGIIISTSLLLGVLGLAIVPPIRNFETTIRVVTSLSGEMIDCSQGVLSLNKSKPFDAIVIPGGGLTLENGSYIPNTAERKRLLAGAIEYVNGKSDIIILQDGILPKETDPNITRKYLQAYVRVISGFTMEIPDSAIKVDNESINTSSGMRYLRDNDSMSREKKYLVIDSRSHVNRSVADGCDMGMAMTGESAEELIASIDLNQAIINARGDSPPFWITFKETTELMSNMYFPGGYELTVPLKYASLLLDESKISQTSPELLLSIILSLMILQKNKKLRKNHTVFKKH